MKERLIYGVGVNDASYVTSRKETIGYFEGKRKRRLVWECPYYRIWSGIIGRCYNKKKLERYPTYTGCSVCEEWLTFSSFKAWMETQDWENKHIDKDFLVRGNKVYSPETCVFVDPVVNTFIIDRGRDRGPHKIGACLHNKQRNTFFGHCNNPFTKEQEYLGIFATEEDAHQAWLKRKTEHAYALASQQTDPSVAKALIDRYENYE